MVVSDEINRAIGKRLRMLREEEGLDQIDIWGAGSGQRKVSNLEQGKAKADVATLLYWHGKGYDLNWIVTGQGAKKREYSDEFISLLEFKANILKMVKKHS